VLREKEKEFSLKKINYSPTFRRGGGKKTGRVNTRVGGGGGVGKAGNSQMFEFGRILALPDWKRGVEDDFD